MNHLTRIFSALILALIAFETIALQTIVNGPPGSGSFGQDILRLPNGNFAVSDPLFDLNAQVVDVGAVYMYSPDAQLISVLTGALANDQIGSELIALPSGDFLVRGGFSGGRGSLTLVDGTTGLSGVVNSGNSLIGGTPGDLLDFRVKALANGKVLLSAPQWDEGAVPNVGAVSLWNPSQPLPTTLNPSNSLMGSFANDSVGRDSVALSNGNYAVVIRDWSFDDRGAVVFGNGQNGIVGRVTLNNAIVGTSSGDRYPGDAGQVVPLPNSNFVIVAPTVDVEIEGGLIAIDAGAVTLVNGTTGTAGIQQGPSPNLANSLIGDANTDLVGYDGIRVLPNGNFVVVSSRWRSDQGAVTWRSGTLSSPDVVSEINSMIGDSSGDLVGGTGVVPLPNSSFVIASGSWDNGTILNVGAVTLCRTPNSVCAGIVGTSNSLVGSTINDFVGSGAYSDSVVAVLPNSNFVVSSPYWNNGAINDVGAATFVNGALPLTGQVSSSNSLIGQAADDWVGIFIWPLSKPNSNVARASNAPQADNNNYLVGSPFWNRLDDDAKGALTWGSGTTGVTGAVSSANSLIGANFGDGVGRCALVLFNGNYVALTPSWKNGAVTTAGASTFGNGLSGVRGVVGTSNSLFGQNSNDFAGRCTSTALPNNHYLISSALPQNGGGITWANGTNGAVGPVSASNSLVGGLAPSTSDLSIFESFSDNYFIAAQYVSSLNRIDSVSLVAGLGPLSGPIAASNTVFASDANPISYVTQSYDVPRKQLIVQQPSLNRVHLLQPGVATSMFDLQSSPNPSALDQSVLLSVRVTSINAPNSGQVTFVASTGEQCVDPTPTPINSTTSSFSCSLSFANGGVRQIGASFTGSNNLAASDATPIDHTVLGGDILFRNGFE